MQSPFEPRGHADPSQMHNEARKLKERGIIIEQEVQNSKAGFEPETHSPLQIESERLTFPRITSARPNVGWLHPASAGDIAELLKTVGVEFCYGLKAIRLSQIQDHSRHILQFGRLNVPGVIVLFEQPCPPWRIHGQLNNQDLIALAMAGATIEAEKRGLYTTVYWSYEDLKNFMLFDVLLHEIGHHLIQQYKGKRGIRVVRTRDHELFARKFAVACRKQWSTSNWTA